MERSRKILIVVLVVVAVSIFGYWQYTSVSQIQMLVMHSTPLDKEDTYSIELEFENPSLLALAAGQTEFVVQVDGKNAGNGILEPFTMQPLGTSVAHGTFQTDANKNTDTKEEQSVKIIGTTRYDVLFASIDVPFVYYPTAEQTREFIHPD